jgi:hypothetical protein
MKKKAQFYLTVFCVIVAFDLVASLASRSLIFDYTKLVPLSWLLYCAAGYFGCKYYGFLRGVVAGLTAGVADSTAGWALSSAIGPYVPQARPPHTFLTVLLVMAVVSITGVILGSVGAVLRKIVGSKRLADA